MVAVDFRLLYFIMQETEQPNFVGYLLDACIAAWYNYTIFL
jgi:hypothetical protein